VTFAEYKCENIFTDDSCELESQDCSLDLTPNVELVDILELVRDKQITLEEAERWIKDERDSGEMDVEQPSRKQVGIFYH